MAREAHRPAATERGGVMATTAFREDPPRYGDLWLGAGGYRRVVRVVRQSDKIQLVRYLIPKCGTRATVRAGEWAKWQEDARLISRTTGE